MSVHGTVLPLFTEIIMPTSVVERPLDTSSFADVIAFTATDPQKGKARRDEAAALRSLFKLLGRDPAARELRPVNRPSLEKLLRALGNAPKAPKGPHLRNIRSRCRKAVQRFLEETGAVVAPLPVSVELPPDWQRVAAAFPRSTGFSPQRFIGFAVRHELKPNDVDDTCVQRFRATALDGLKHPQPHMARLINGWNTLAADTTHGLRNLTPPAPARSRISVAPDDLPAPLREDLEHYLSDRAPRQRMRMSIRDSALPSLRPSSAAKTESLVRQYLGLLQAGGEDIGAFRNLRDAVTLEHIESATHAMLDRQAGKSSSQLNGMLFTLSALARHWTGMSDDDRDSLAEWIEDHRHGYDGMVARNQQRLLMLKDRKHLAALLGLPSRLMAVAARSDSERGAYLAQRAVAIELLLQTAMRIGNLAMLRFDQHVIDTGVGRSGCLFILLAAADVKNREAIKIELPADSAAMLRTYRATYLPRLRHGGNGHLFPGEDGSAKGNGTLGKQVSATILEHSGLHIHPHLFRAIAVFVYLKHHPGDYMTLKRILGDRQLSTITTHYSFLDQMEARRGYQEILATERRSLGNSRGRQPGECRP